MEGMRGFAILFVFLAHYSTSIDPWIASDSSLHWLGGVLHAIGNTGVLLFFVLSGYLVYRSLITKDQPFLRFITRRVARLYPAFTVVFVVYVALSFVFPAESKIPASVSAGAIYLIQNFLLLPGLFPIEPMITVAWTLSYEMFFYVTIGLVIPVFSLRRRSAVWRVAFFAAVAGAAGLYCAAYGGHSRLIMFVSGILLHEALEGRRVAVPGSAVALLALVTGVLTVLVPAEGSTGYVLKVGILFGALFAMCYSCFSQPAGWLARGFSWTPLRWLGNMSYSYFLLHGVALKACFLMLASWLPAAERGPWLVWALMPAVFALTLIPTGALYLAVERPFSFAPRPARGAVEKGKTIRDFPPLESGIDPIVTGRARLYL
jgi:peptidoglycan/LPS O-acetylase OafA/YrhL